MSPQFLPVPGSDERSRRLTIDSVRRRALERLYLRLTAVDELILSLETYAAQGPIRAPISVLEKSS